MLYISWICSHWLNSSVDRSDALLLLLTTTFVSAGHDVSSSGFSVAIDASSHLDSVRLYTEALNIKKKLRASLVTLF